MRFVSEERDETFPYKYNTKVISVQSKGIQYPYAEMRKLGVGEGRYFEESGRTELWSINKCDC